MWAQIISIMFSVSICTYTVDADSTNALPATGVAHF